jgi:hypothetical protein
MFYIFKRTTEKTQAIERSTDEDHALARMEYLALNNMDEKTTGFYVESGDNRLIAEWEV